MLADHARVASMLPGSRLPWLARARNAALECFAQGGFPTTHDEDWRFTNVSRIERQALMAMTAATPDLAPPRNC